MLDYLIFRCYWQHNSNQHQAGGKKSKSDAHYGPLALLLFTGLSLFSLQPEMSTPGHVRRLLWLRGILWSLSDLDYRAERHWVGEESWQIYQGTAPTSFQDYSGGREWSQSQQSSIENHVYVGLLDVWIIIQFSKNTYMVFLFEELPFVSLQYIKFYSKMCIII